MKTESIIHSTTINGKVVTGKAYLQPGANNWIGVFTVADNLLEGKPKQWELGTIEYEGPFFCRDESTAGRGKARITYVDRTIRNHRLRINVEGIEEPDLKNKDLAKNIPFRYNENLPRTSLKPQRFGVK